MIVLNTAALLCLVTVTKLWLYNCWKYHKIQTHFALTSPAEQAIQYYQKQMTNELYIMHILHE